MAQRTNSVAWGLAVLLAVLLLGGAGVGIRHTYEVHLTYYAGARSIECGTLFEFNRFLFLGPLRFTWWRRDLPKRTKKPR